MNTTNFNWHGRIDSKAESSTLRLHQIIKTIYDDDLNSVQQGMALIGYACEEGVRRNQGRIGSIDGPDAIRKAMANMASHFKTPIYDLGNCSCPDKDMENTQMAFSKKVTKALSAQHLVIGLGGGHDMAFASGSGVLNYINQYNSASRLGIINIDAHFDLRQPQTSGNSGTPFYQLAKAYPNNFNYLVLGIQHYGNTQQLFKTADEFNVAYILRDAINSSNEAHRDWKTQITKWIENVDHIYLSVDLDSLDMAICPGVSAPSINGLQLKEVLDILNTVLSSNKLLVIDIAEMNPKFDIDNRTAKLAAYLVYYFILHHDKTSQR